MTLRARVLQSFPNDPELWMALFPQMSGDLQWRNFPLLPPADLITGLMELTVMTAAEGHGELIADL